MIDIYQFFYESSIFAKKFQNIIFFLKKKKYDNLFIFFFLKICRNLKNHQYLSKFSKTSISLKNLRILLFFVKVSKIIIFWPNFFKLYHISGYHISIASIQRPVS